MLPAPAGLSERKAEQISMTTPGMQGEVSPESMGKMHHQPSETRPTRNPPLPQLLGNTAEQRRLKRWTG
jgi:hypothetical protein